MKWMLLVVSFAFLSACGDKPKGALNIIHSKFNNGEYEKAISKAFRAESKYEFTDAESAELNFMIAESYFKLEEIEKARDMYKLVIDKYPETTFATLSTSALKSMQ